VTAHISLLPRCCVALWHPAPGSGNRYIGPGVTIHVSVGVQEGSLYDVFLNDQPLTSSGKRAADKNWFEGSVRDCYLCRCLGLASRNIGIEKRARRSKGP
jgi:hypothetical protein